MKVKTEPSAVTRTAALECQRMFVALVESGFTENQALMMLGTMLGTMAATSTGEAE